MGWLFHVGASFRWAPPLGGHLFLGKGPKMKDKGPDRVAPWVWVWGCGGVGAPQVGLRKHLSPPPVCQTWGPPMVACHGSLAYGPGIRVWRPGIWACHGGQAPGGLAWRSAAVYRTPGRGEGKLPPRGSRRRPRGRGHPVRGSRRAKAFSVRLRLLRARFTSDGSGEQSGGDRAGEAAVDKTSVYASSSASGVAPPMISGGSAPLHGAAQRRCSVRPRAAPPAAPRTEKCAGWPQLSASGSGRRSRCGATAAARAARFLVRSSREEDPRSQPDSGRPRDRRCPLSRAIPRPLTDAAKPTPAGLLGAPRCARRPRGRLACS
eukprot:356961-Chlamydomonas_euryale.AAC.3